jgi:hypothetical protein
MFIIDLVVGRTGLDFSEPFRFEAVVIGQ